VGISLQSGQHWRRAFQVRGNQAVNHGDHVRMIETGVDIIALFVGSTTLSDAYPAQGSWDDVKGTLQGRRAQRFIYLFIPKWAIS
jgi:hypothetical protein